MHGPQIALNFNSVSSALKDSKKVQKVFENYVSCVHVSDQSVRLSTNPSDINYPKHFYFHWPKVSHTTT